MAQLNDHILNEWKKNQHSSALNEKIQNEFNTLREIAELLRKEGTSLRIENKELLCH